MYHSVLTKLSCFSSPWWLCCPVTTPLDHHHQNTHKEGGHKVSWLKDPSKNEQKHSRESWLACCRIQSHIPICVCTRGSEGDLYSQCLPDKTQPKMCGCLMPTPEHASISEFPFGMPISVLLAPAPSCQDPHSHKHQTVQRQGSSGIISCLSASMSGPLPPTGSGRYLRPDSNQTSFPPFHHSTPGRSKQTDPSDTNSVCVTQQTIPTQPCYQTVLSGHQ